LLREQAERTPEAIALEAGGEKVSYREVFQRADRLAARLRGRGVTRDSVVGLFIDRHPRMLEAMLGVLVAGGGYLPLEPGLPRDRLAFMLEDAGASVLLTRKGLLEQLPPHAAQVVCIDEEEAPVPALRVGGGPSPIRSRICFTPRAPRASPRVSRCHTERS
jgi:non-ribosomal peptide synthetase component F